MLALLAEGASTRGISSKMGYTEGTVRVYLHDVYKVLGVKNRTQAVLWYLNRVGEPKYEAPALSLADETFGDTALREGLFGALGVMESFLGPYGRQWEVAVRLKGEVVDEATLARRGRARVLWQALLKADYQRTRDLYDDGVTETMLYEAPSEAMLVMSLLLIGGCSHASDRLFAQLARKGKAAGGLSVHEIAMLKALRGALYASNGSAILSLHEIARKNDRNAVLKQVAMAALFYVYRFRKDVERARQTANAIWAEAEASRSGLEAMGIRPLRSEASLPNPVGDSSRRPRKRLGRAVAVQ